MLVEVSKILIIQIWLPQFLKRMSEIDTSLPGNSYFLMQSNIYFENGM